LSIPMKSGRSGVQFPITALPISQPMKQRKD